MAHTYTRTSQIDHTFRFTVRAAAAAAAEEEAKNTLQDVNRK